MTTIEISLKDTARPALRVVTAKARNPRAGLMIAGRAVANRLKTHFRQKNQTPNKLGGTRQNFWLRVGQGVNAPEPVDNNTVRVSISHPAILQKIYGGLITAKRAGALTIPLRPEAYGRRVSVLERALNIKLFRVKDVLVAKGADGKLIAYYALRKSVNQKADPTALPPTAELQRIAEENFYRWLQTPVEAAQ